MSTVSSKILLFGEYGLIHDSMGLSIPFAKYSGTFTYQAQKFNAQEAIKSNQHLKNFAIQIKDWISQDQLDFDFNIEKLLTDIEKGLIFDSDIPQGFGVGSSGALVAGLYLLYAPVALTFKEKGKKLNSSDRIIIKRHLQQLESYFHGSSSGIDPLICFLQEPLLIKNKSQIDTVSFPKISDNTKGAIFLINTEQTGMTSQLVKLFNEKCKDEKYLNLVNNSLIPFTNNCINHFLAGDIKQLLTEVKHLSKFVLNHLNPMVPQEYQEMMQRGLDTGKYTIKLCGSGGGGYLLGFTEDIEDTLKELKDYKIEILSRF